MPTPTKPFAVLSGEKKSHRTKAELKQRKEAEEALTSGNILKEKTEVRKNGKAHKEFLRINKLLKDIQKNDALYENIINRYCMILAECEEYEEKQQSFYRDLEELTKSKEHLIDSEEMSQGSYFRMKLNMQKSILSLDKQLQAKRKMLLDIEKENIFTIASALRSIPKKQEKTSNPLLDALNG